MKKILFSLLNFLLFIGITYAESIPSGNYDITEEIHYPITIKTENGAEIKKVELCYVGKKYDDCYKLELQQDGTYVIVDEYNYHCDNCTFEDNYDTNYVTVYFKANGFKRSQKYNVNQRTDYEPTLVDDNNVHQIITDSFEDLDTIVLEQKNSISQCDVITGSGHNIGDEIDCAGERFYIIEETDTEVRALAKYNLYVGYEVLDARPNVLYDSYTEAKSACQALGPTYFYQYYNNKYFCVSARELVYEEVKQSSNAIGAHGDISGQPVLPEIGNVRMNYWNLDKFTTQPNISGYNEGYYYDGVQKFRELDDISGYLDSYYLYFEENNFNIIDINLPLVSDIYYINNKLNGTTMDLKNWAENAQKVDGVYPSYSTHYLYGSLKDYFSNNASWLWSTTYWTNTQDQLNNYFFVDTLGELCSAESCPTGLGAGLRPVITISKETIKYNIVIKTDGNGDIKLEKVMAEGGELVRFTVEPKPGYVLSELLVIDANGKTIRVEGNTFTMPTSDVIIQAKFTKENPNTSTGAIVTYLILVSITSLIIIGINYKKTKEF